MKKGPAEVFCGSSLEIFISYFVFMQYCRPKKKKKKKAGEKELASVADRTCWQEWEYATGRNR